MPHLAVSHIAKSYDGNPAVRDISFEVAPGRVLALCGENGAGKSTLMKMLSGATRPDSGEILLDGKAVAIAGPSDAMALGIRTVYQELSLLPHLSVAENMLLGRMPTRGLSFVIDWPTANRIAARVLADFGFPEIDPTALVGSLSVARQQIVEIAKALVAEPKILILDEPTAVISGAEAAKLFDKVRSLAASGTTVLYISHRLEEIYAIADEIVVLKDGRSVLSGAGRRARPGTPDPCHGRTAAFGDLPGAQGRGRQAGAGGRQARRSATSSRMSASTCAPARSSACSAWSAAAARRSPRRSSARRRPKAAVSS